MTKVVAIGGGHGLSRVLLACRRLGLAPTAVVTVADDGGSSGRLRRDLGIIALGDLRMALLALAREEALADLLAHRYADGDLKGHALGNLLLLALAERADGDILHALRRAEVLLRCAGSVLPSTTAAVQLSARIAGRRVDGQARVTAASGRIDDLWLDPPDPPVCPQARAAVMAADVVILGPGSLYTSVIANLLVPDLRRALRRSEAHLVHVANVQAAPGESAEMSLDDQVRRLEDAIGGRRIDTLVVHEGPAPAGRGAPLRPSGALMARPLVSADLLQRDAAGVVGRAHDPARLADALAEVMAAPSAMSRAT